MMLVTISISVLALATLIVIHELGHFALARWSGMKVERFSIGFGPVLVRKQLGETEWVISAVPLGGYVKIAGMDPSESNEDPRAYNNKPVWKRLAVIAAGPMANYLLAAVIFAFVLLVGPLVPDMSRTTVGQTMPGMPAAEAGMTAGDTILEVGDQPVDSWESFQISIHQRAGEETHLKVQRGGDVLDLRITPNPVEVEGRTIGQIGVFPSTKRGEGRPVGQALLGGVTYTWEWNARIIGALANIVLGKEKADVQGPVGIVRETHRAAEQGIVPLVLLAAIISVHLALFNLLPLPALDGGRLAFLLAEVVLRRPVNAKIEVAVHAVGFVLLLGLILLVTVKDVGRLFGAS